jgi:hypothetical protein
MVERAMTRFDLKPERLAADTAYGTGRTLKSLIDRGIEPHIPVWDKSRRQDGTFSRADFHYDAQRDRYACPAGKTLKTTGKVLSDNTIRYLASTHDCGPRPLKDRCCPNTPRRKIPRDINESVRDRVRELAKTKAFDRSRRERKKVEMAFAHLKRILKLDRLRLRGLTGARDEVLKVEMAFAHLKRILKLDRLRLRGLTGARDEVLLAATAQNLRKLARYVGRSPPIPRTA